MEPQITINKGRTKVLSVQLAMDVSRDTFTSEIRVDKDRTSDLIATWNVAFENDGSDGALVLTLDDAVTGAIVQSKGYWDMKRVSNGEPLDVFANPVEVLFKEPVTA